MKAPAVSPAVLEVEARVRTLLADGPVPRRKVNGAVGERLEGMTAHARRRLGVETVGSEGVPHYRLPA